MQLYMYFKPTEKDWKGGLFQKSSNPPSFLIGELLVLAGSKYPHPVTNNAPSVSARLQKAHYPQGVRIMAGGRCGCWIQV